MSKLTVCGFLGCTAIAAAAWTYQSSNLFIAGNLASSSVLMHNGVAYVPIKDVATALKMVASKTARGIELSDAGGTNQASGITGKIGDTLWNGYGRFQVVKLIRGKEYTNQFSGDNQKVTPASTSGDLVVLVCRIKNGLPNKITVGLPGGNDTALADTNSHSFGMRTGMSMDISSRGVDLLPGAALDFALTFDVPEGAELGDLVYQLNFMGSGTNGAEKKKFRVSMKQ